MSIRAETGFSLKDDLFNRKSVALLGARLHQALPSFNQGRFERAAMRAFPSLELKARIDALVTLCAEQLPESMPAATAVWQQALPPILDPNLSDDDFGEYIWVVPGTYIAKYGCTDADLDSSLSFLGEATKRFSSESAIRPFLKKYPQVTMDYVRRFAVADNYHVRRLASEGIRPFLPWAQRVILPLPDVLGVLDSLHADRTRYVTRSVANTLNDLSKLDHDLVVEKLSQWREAGLQETAELGWMTRHSLRTLARTDHRGALSLLGYSDKPDVRISHLNVPQSVVVGDSLIWKANVYSAKAQRLKFTLRLHYLKANGSHSAKVFALKELDLRKAETLSLEKRVSFKPITTRVMYPGTHYVELLVNGKPRQKRAFELNLEDAI